MRAGFAKGKVNPPSGSLMEGLGQQGPCERIHDDLFVRGLFLRHGDEKVLILAYDLLFFERRNIDRFKAAVGRELHLPPGRILINTSHTHAGPRLTEWAYGGAPEPVYLDKIEAATVQTALEAREAQRAVTVWAGMTHTDVPVSRRRPNADGQAEWAPYQDGEVCRALPYCLFKDPADKVVAMLVSVSCHPSMIYSLDFSADYPGAAVRRLNQTFGTDGCMFLQGAGGDTKPRRIAAATHWRHGTWEDVAATGLEIALAVIAAVEAGPTRVEPALGCSLADMHWPLAALPTRDELEGMRDDAAERQGRRRWAADMLRRWAVLGALPTHAPVALHVIRIGTGLRLVGLEGELVGELGNRIIATAGEGVTFPLGYANGAQLYLPSDRMLPEHGYEVDSYWEYHWPAPLAAGIDERLTRAVRAVCHD